MYDTVSALFDDAIAREGKNIQSYDGNTNYTVFFRRNDDKNVSRDRKTIFYSIDAGIVKGQLLKYNNENYLVINQETAENNVYYKSDLFQTNAFINGISDGIETNLPTYSSEMTSSIAGSSSTVLEVDGSVRMITVDNELSRTLSINTVYATLGANWKIRNIFFKDGLAYVYSEQTTDAAPTYILTITGASDSYYVGDTAALGTLAKRGNDTVTNATIQWATSDSSLATIDTSGNISFLAEGTVTITASWVEHSITATKDISIAVHEVTPTYKWYYLDSANNKTYIDATQTTINILEDDYDTFGIEKWLGTTIAEQNDTYTFTITANGATSTNYTATVIGTDQYKVNNNHEYNNSYLYLTASSSSSATLDFEVYIQLGGEW